MARIERNRLAQRRDRLLHSLASVICAGEVVLKCRMVGDEAGCLLQLCDGEIVGPDLIEVCP
jgi:hypothetical protein